MSSSSPVATKADAPIPFALTAVDAPAAQLPAVIPPKPRESVIDSVSKSLKGAGQAIGSVATKVGNTAGVEGLWLWCKGVGAVAGYLAPAAALVWAGAHLAGFPPVGPDIYKWGMGLGAAAGIAQSLYQGDAGLGNIDEYKKEHSKLPRLRSFLDVCGFLVAPALGAGYLAASAFGGDIGLFAGIGGAVVGSSIGLTTLSVRFKRNKS